MRAPRWWRALIGLSHPVYTVVLDDYRRSDRGWTSQRSLSSRCRVWSDSGAKRPSARVSARSRRLSIVHAHSGGLPPKRPSPSSSCCCRLGYRVDPGSGSWSPQRGPIGQSHSESLAAELASRALPARRRGQTKVSRWEAPEGDVGAVRAMRGSGWSPIPEARDSSEGDGRSLRDRGRHLLALLPSPARARATAANS